MRLRTKAVLVVGLILTFALGSVTLLMIRTSTADLEEALQGKALVLGQEMAQEIRKFFDLGLDLEDLKNFSERCEDLVEAHGNFSTAFVADEKGVVRFHNDPQKVGGAVPEEYFDASRPPVAIRQVVAVHGGERGYDTLIPIHDNQGNYRAAVVLTLMGKAVTGKVYHLLRNSLLIGVLSFLVALLLAVFFFNTQVAQPLSSLVESSRAAADGDLSQVVSMRSRDEIGELSRAFGEMLRQIQKRDLELTLHRHQLEELVEARTAELATTNLDLERELEERERAEKALLISEKEYRRLSQEFNALLDAIPDRITLLSRGLEVLWANSGATAGTNKGKDAAVGSLCHSLLHDRDTPCHPCPVQRTFSSGEPELDSMPTADGKYWEVRTIPLHDEAGEVRNVIEVAREITDQRRLEEQLRHSQKIEAVGQLAGGVAHDFNNILNVIMGFSTLIQMKTQEDKDLQHYIQQIMTSSERAADLTRGLLAFSRKQIIDPVPVDVNRILTNTEKLLGRLITEDIQLTMDLAGETMMVRADSNQIDQVLINLATNARDAMPQGGRLMLGTRIANIGEEFIEAHGYGTAGSYALITVSDSGSGMGQKVQRRIFEPFFTTKDVGKGTGLGLAIVYGIVKQHGGIINCYSEPGSGTTFKIYLPLTESAPEQDAVEVPLTMRGGAETILVAEDDEQVRTLTVELLKQYGYNVLSAGDGEDAVRVYRKNGDQVHLLLLDVIMPRMNGREAYEAIREINPGVKALFTSGYTADIIHKKGALDKEFNFIDKPVMPHELLKKLREILDTPSRFN